MKKNLLKFISSLIGKVATKANSYSTIGLYSPKIPKELREKEKINY